MISIYPYHTCIYILLIRAGLCWGSLYALEYSIAIYEETFLLSHIFLTLRRQVVEARPQAAFGQKNWPTNGASHIYSLFTPYVFSDVVGV